MAKRGRPIGVRHQEDVRRKIQSSQLLNRLTNHALGNLKNPMDATQVSAALGVLKKALPDLTATEISGDLTMTHERQLEQLK